MGIMQNYPRVNINQFAEEGMYKVQVFEVFCRKVGNLMS